MMKILIAVNAAHIMSTVGRYLFPKIQMTIVMRQIA